MPRQRVYAVGVDHDGAGCVLQHGSQHPSRACPEAAADQAGIRRLQPRQELRHGTRRERAVLLVRQRKDHRLKELSRDDRIDAARHAHIDQSRTCPRRSHGGQRGRSRVAPRTAEKQHAPKVALVRRARASGQAAPQHRLRYGQKIIHFSSAPFRFHYSRRAEIVKYRLLFANGCGRIIGN